MGEDAKYAELSQAASELDGALNALEAALVQAGRSVAVIRRNADQLSNLTQLVREMEAAMDRARRSLDVAGIDQQVTPTPLRPLPVQPEAEALRAPPTAPEPHAGELPASISAPDALADEPLASTSEPASPAPEPEPSEATQTWAPESAAPAAAGEAPSHCLRLGVASKGGSLDLKAVDGSVNENPAVVDVALLDYDGRRATLKLWLNAAADPVGVRDALLGSLRRRLGDEQDAEVSIEFEDESAA